mgnify:CR=1 FL=1
MYHMGIGFTTAQVPERAASIIADLRQRSDARNRAMVERINAHLQPVTADYEVDILPLTPNGNATERHMLTAYVTAAERVYPDRAEQVRFWAEKLGMTPAEIDAMIDDVPSFKNVIRAKLMKRGGAGYVQPGPESFPTVDEFHEMISLCGALLITSSTVLAVGASCYVGAWVTARAIRSRPHRDARPYPAR